VSVASTESSTFPFSARETVHLNVAGADAASMGWEQPPRDEDFGGQETDLNQHV